MAEADRRKQLLLAYLGYYHGAIDGIWGKQSRAAAEAFRRDYMEDTSGEDLLHRLREVIWTGEEPDGKRDFWKEIRWFRREEFACRCGSCGGFPREPEESLIRTADRIRTALGCPVTVSSGVRCEAHNRAVGGVANSRHLTGKAMDICAAGKSARELLALVQRQETVRYAYAIDSRFVHMDVA